MSIFQSNQKSRATETEPRTEEDFEVQYYEKAIGEAGFGIFNILLLATAFLGTTAIIFETSSISYIMPSAECDLHLSLVDKGLLNGITYAGMISSSLPWAFYSDTKGRRLVLVITHLSNSVFLVLSAFTQTKHELILFKFFSGFCICGGYCTLVTYVSELHSRRYRTYVVLLFGIMLNTATFILPFFAALILPQRWHINIGPMHFHSWNLYLLIIGIPSGLCGFIFMKFPESPKYLLARSKNEDAYEIMVNIYHFNSGQPVETYPVRETGPIRETIAKSANMWAIVKNGCKQLESIFKRPYVWRAIILPILEFCTLACQNTFRLWLPQIFAIIEKLNKTKGKEITICEIFTFYLTQSSNSTANVEKCVVNVRTYTDNFIVTGFSFFAFLLAYGIACCITESVILYSSYFISCCASLGLYFSSSESSIVFMSSLYLAMENVASTAVMNATACLFPTKMRTTMIAIVMMVGRCGSLLGNIYYPFLIEMGCLPPIAVMASLSLAAFILSLFLPSPSRVAFK